MRLNITGGGMISAVGPDLHTCCAAIRAGIVRPQEIPHFSLLDEDSQEAIPLVGMPIHGFSEGFNILGLWIRVGVGCLENLAEQGGLPDASDKNFWSSTGLIAVTPRVTDARFDSDESYTAEQLKDAYFSRVLKVLRFPIATENVDVVSIGHAGAIAAVARAEAMMTANRLDRVIVVAVDSYLDPMTLDWLAESDRLKTSDNPIGLTPGEAGACFLLESPASTQARRASVHAVIHDPATGTEQNHYFTEQPSQGIALASVIPRALASSGASLPFGGDVISDLNGEAWRAYELGSARVRLTKQLAADANFLFPCTSLGEIGCASGAASICIAVRSLQRGYSSADTSLVISSSDYGEVGAVCVSRAVSV